MTHKLNESSSDPSSKCIKTYHNSPSLSTSGHLSICLSQNQRKRPTCQQSLCDGLRGRGVQVKVSDFPCFDICFSPQYLISKIGWLAPQLATTHELLRDEVRHYALNIRVLYGKTPQVFFRKFWEEAMQKQVKESIFLLFREDIMNI